MLAIALLALGIFSRLLIHIPNFTPLIAVALFSGVYLKRKQAVLLPLMLLAVTDLIIGFHETMFFTWGSVILIVLVGNWLKGKKSFANITMSSLASSVAFFIITNFGVWFVSNLYPMTWTGLKDCFILAIPFFRNEVLATVLYTAVLFGAYEFLALRLKNTRFATAL